LGDSLPDSQGSTLETDMVSRPNTITRLFSPKVPVALLLLIGSLLAGCDGADVTNRNATTSTVAALSSNHKKIVCTTGMVADLVRNVARPLIENHQLEVAQLMSDEVDPHLFKTSPGDIQLMQQADAIVYSGLHLEGKMGQVFENLARRRKVLAVAEHLPTDLLLKVDDHFSDPHVWFDVGLWSRCLEPVTALLVEMFPDRKSDLENSAAEYRKQLDQLDGRCRTEIVSIPESQRVLITAHDAFHYWGRAYGIEVKAIQGISTESEAGVRQINDLVKFITERKIKAVFVETTVSDRAVLALIEGCSQSGHKITIGGSLFSDAMGKLGTPEGTYVGMVEHNLRTMVQALK